MKKILVIDDEQYVLDVIETILADMGYEVKTFADTQEGEQAAVSTDYNLILIDIRMPGRNGAEITEAVLAAKPDANILLITGYPSDPLVSRALNAGARGILKKPFEIAKILDYLQ